MLWKQFSEVSMHGVQDCGMHLLSGWVCSVVY